ncbi:MAG: DegT/DnrJ/EryC1/StrS family aminotransferase [Proteobacteria bacterium]|nr:DegT/DnrJ/EryC1/StrS family aminotransferase [Pseudomonadota bacterium]MBI3499647.1 DegT/DnrJ/EryC1/StrS family aminotransferase [Pseudomonadota bacterium]
MAGLSVPQSDPKAGYLAHKAEIDAAIARTLDSGWYILGREVAAFEEEFSRFVGLAHGIGVANGTDALVLALRALDIGPGATVATVSHTAVATVAAIELVGATPLLIDIDPGRYTMDPGELETVLAGEGKRIKAVIPVHLYGQPAAIQDIQKLADRLGVAVIEDCSQAHGAMVGNTQVGRFGRIACYSLYPTKNLGALGDGGVVLSDDKALAGRVRELREYGWRERYVSAIAGTNSRLDELQAAILRVKLNHLAADNERRRRIATDYDSGLAGLGLGLPVRAAGATHVYHQYVVTTAVRARLRELLKERGIATNIHYPVPVHRQPAYAGRVPLGPAQCRQTERLAEKILSLPMYPQLSRAQIDHVIGSLRDTVQRTQ